MTESSFRKWFASTACPLIAGTFGPLANAFNICALVQSWRDDSGGYSIADPAWLLAANSLSVAFGVLANIILLLNMRGQRHVRIAVAQPLTTGGFSFASLILICLLVVCGSLDSFESGPLVSFSQAFYYATFAAGLYFLIAVLSFVTCIATIGDDKPDRHFVLDNNERTLMLQTMSFVGFMVVGAAVFSKIEGWRYLDAFYWSNFTLLTIGLGPFYPATHLGRSLLMPYAIGGVFAVGLIIGSIRSMLLESARTKIRARTTEKDRQKMLRGYEPKYHEFKSTLDARRFEFDTMKHIRHRAYIKNKYSSLGVSILLTSIIWFIGAVIFWYAESEQKWTYFESLYFAYTALMTLGYGDFLPESNFGRVFFVLWGLLAIPALTVLISDLGDMFMKGFADFVAWTHSVNPGEEGEKSSNTILSILKRICKDVAIRLKVKRKANSSSRTDELRQGSINEILVNRLTTDDQTKSRSYGTERNESENRKNLRFYHYVLVKEIICLIRDSEATPPKQYTFDEWAYFLNLVGEDIERMNWMGRQSPLLSGKAESDWILEGLLSRLQHQMRLPLSGMAEQEPNAPVSIAGL